MDKPHARPPARRRPRGRPAPPAQKPARVEHDPHVEEQLDSGLEETFPASDPVSINPGSD